MLVNITIPVLNEEVVLESSITRLHTFLEQNLNQEWEIVIADNGSTDDTKNISQSLSKRYSQVKFTKLEVAGRGRALKHAWKNSSANILSYMDVDLSTSLESFPKLILSVINQECDIAIGTRISKKSSTVRSLKREILSRSYNRILQALFPIKITDAQCGFKAISKNTFQNLLPHTQESGWFFDSELLVIASHLGYQILEHPVHWIEDKDSRVKILSTIAEDLRGMFRLKKRLPTIPNTRSKNEIV